MSIYEQNWNGKRRGDTSQKKMGDIINNTICSKESANCNCVCITSSFQFYGKPFRLWNLHVESIILPLERRIDRVETLAFLRL